MGSATYDCPECGTSIRVSRGNNANSAHYAAWCEKAGRLCTDCDRKRFQAAHAASVAAAAADPRNADLPTLTGTDKQAAWATALRLEALPLLEEGFDQASRLIEEYRQDFSPGAYLEITDALQLLKAETVGQSEARYWIDNRMMHAINKGAFRERLMERFATLCPTANVEREAAMAARKSK